jgi:hypothetical protein
MKQLKPRVCSVVITTGYVLEDRDSIPSVDWEFFSSPPRPDWLGIPPILLTNVYRGGGALSPGVKRPGREADQSPPSSAEVKNA